MTTAAPDTSGRYSSRTWTSNATEVTASTGRRGQPDPPFHRGQVLTTASWVTITPLGTPVDPEV